MIALTQRTSQWLQNHPSHAALKLDWQNYFNTINRCNLLSIVKRSIPDLYPMLWHSTADQRTATSLRSSLSKLRFRRIKTPLLECCALILRNLPFATIPQSAHHHFRRSPPETQLPRLPPATQRFVQETFLHRLRDEKSLVSLR